MLLFLTISNDGAKSASDAGNLWSLPSVNDEYGLDKSAFLSADTNDDEEDDLDWSTILGGSFQADTSKLCWVNSNSFSLMLLELDYLC